MVSTGEHQGQISIEDAPLISPRVMEKDVVPLERSSQNKKAPCCTFRKSFAEHQMTLKQFISNWSQQQDVVLDRALYELGVTVCSECVCNQCSFPSTQLTARTSPEPIPIITTSSIPLWSDQPTSSPRPPITGSAFAEHVEVHRTDSRQSATQEIQPPFQAPFYESANTHTTLNTNAGGTPRSRNSSSTIHSVIPPWSNHAEAPARGTGMAALEHQKSEDDNLLTFFGDRIAKNNKSAVTKMMNFMGLQERGDKAKREPRRTTTTESNFSECSSARDYRLLSRMGKSFREGLHRIEWQTGPPQKKGCLSRIVLSKLFETASCIVILTNSGFLAYTSNYARQNLDKPSTVTMHVVEAVFCMFYTLELMMRLCVYGRYFFLGVDWRWNILDVVLVVFAINDQISHVIEASATQVVQNMSFLRVMRLMRMMKLLRVIRLMRMFRELRIIMNSIMGSVKAMLWSMLLVFSIVFLFAMCFVQASTEYLQNHSITVTEQTRDELDKFWGTVGSSMNSLYMAVTGGEDWSKVARPLREVGTTFYFIFILYVGFMMAVVANTLTSMFVEAAILNGDKDLEQSIHRELENINEHVATLQKWFEKIDVDKDGEIDFQEFRRHCDAPEMIAFAKSMELDTLDMRRFFSIISCNGTRAVDLETFVVGCVKLQGMARNMDLMDLIYNFRIFVKDISESVEAVSEEVAAIKMQMAAVNMPSESPSHACNDLGKRELKAQM